MVHNAHSNMKILAVTLIFGLALASPQRPEGAGPGRGPPEGLGGPKVHADQVEKLCGFTCESGEVWAKPLEDGEGCDYAAGDELPERPQGRPPRPPRCTEGDTVEVFVMGIHLQRLI